MARNLRQAAGLPVLALFSTLIAVSYALDDFLGSSLTWSIDQQFVTNPDHRNITFRLRTAWADIDITKCNFVVRENIQLNSPDCTDEIVRDRYGALKYHVCNHETCGPAERVGSGFEIANSFTVLDFVQGADTMYSKERVLTGLLEVNVTVPLLGMAVLAFFTRSNIPSRAAPIGADTGVTFSLFFVADATNDPSQYWLSREFMGDTPYLYTPTWIRLCSVGNQNEAFAYDCDTSGPSDALVVRRRIQNYFSPEPQFPLLHVRTRPGDTRTLTTHLKFADYDGQHLVAHARSCQLSAGTCLQTSAETTTNVTHSKLLPASFVNPVGDAASEDDIDAVLELQDYTWRRLESATGRVSYAYQTLPFGRPTFTDEGTLVQTHYTVTAQHADCAAAETIPTMRAVDSETGEPLPDNELVCFHSQPCSFNISVDALTEPIAVRAATGFERLCTLLDPARCGCQSSQGGVQHRCTHELRESELGQERSGTAVVECFVAESGGCVSAPVCVKVEVRSHQPQLVHPTPMEANSVDELGSIIPGSTDVPACLGVPLQLVINATDGDAGDGVRIFVEEDVERDRVGFFQEKDFTTRGGEVCEHSPFSRYGATRSGDNSLQVSANTLLFPSLDSSIIALYAGNVTFVPTTTTQSVEYTLTLEERNGVYIKRVCDGTPDCRETFVSVDPVLCGTVYDNSRSRWGRWQGKVASAELGVHGLGDFAGEEHCWRVKLLAPPKFVTNSTSCAPVGNSPRLRYECTPFAEDPQLIMDTTGNPRAWRDIALSVNQPFSVLFTAVDPNVDDSISLFVSEDPGVPPGMTVGRSQCVPRTVGPFPPRRSMEGNCDANQPQVESACSMATMRLDWTPTVVDMGSEFRVCVVARDDSTLCAGNEQRATSRGWYGEEQCMRLRVIQPSFAWGTSWVDELMLPSAAGPPVLSGYVGCVLSFNLTLIETTFFGSNFSSDGYGIAVQRGPAETDMARVGARLEEEGKLRVTSDAGGAAVLYSVHPQLGSEGHLIHLCFAAGVAGAGATGGVCLGEEGEYGVGYKSCSADSECASGTCTPTCVAVKIEKCRYCVPDGDTLNTVMAGYGIETNWMRVWTLNADGTGALGTKCSKNLDCEARDDDVIDNPELILRGEGGVGKRILWAGLLYRPQMSEGVEALGCRFRTSMKSLAAANPELDVRPGAEVQAGQEVCFIACNNRGVLASDALAGCL